MTETFYEVAYTITYNSYDLDNYPVCSIEEVGTLESDSLEGLYLQISNLYSNIICPPIDIEGNVIEQDLDDLCSNNQRNIEFKAIRKITIEEEFDVADSWKDMPTWKSYVSKRVDVIIAKNNAEKLKQKQLNDARYQEYLNLKQEFEGSGS